MYVKTHNGEVEKFPYTIGNLRKENPNTSFPKIISDERLAEYSVFPVSRTDEPPIDERTQKVFESNVPVFVNGAWLLNWEIVEKTQEEIDEYDNQKINSIRSERNGLLSECDWTQLPDAPVDKSAWATYRQALRDITAQAGFPDSVEWPAKPE